MEESLTILKEYALSSDNLWLSAKLQLLEKEIEIEIINTQIKMLEKLQIMKVNEVAWDNLKKQIEMHLKEDPNLTDIKINYQMKIPTFGTRNYLNLNVSINK